MGEHARVRRLPGYGAGGNAISAEPPHRYAGSGGALGLVLLGVRDRPRVVSHTNGRVERLRRWVIALAVVVVFAAFAAPFSLGYFFLTQSNETQLAVQCSVAESNHSQLEALASISHRLGIPVDFTIPEVPPECAGT